MPGTAMRRKVIRNLVVRLRAAVTGSIFVMFHPISMRVDLGKPATTPKYFAHLGFENFVALNFEMVRVGSSEV